jgi:RNA polymerase sigma factor (TIGR02999 family)
MSDAALAEVTGKLLALRSGGQGALNALLPVVYDELRKLARHHLRRGRDEETLESRVLVHEAYLRLVDQSRVEWRDRAHFFGLASNLMRCILVDHYRNKHAQKRGGVTPRVPLDDAAVEAAGVSGNENILALDEALTRLAQLDPQQARIVELRYFGGLSIEEAAEVVGVSPATVKNRWSLARAWLQRELRGI